MKKFNFKYKFVILSLLFIFALSVVSVAFSLPNSTVEGKANDIVSSMKLSNAQYQSFDKNIVINEEKVCDITETFVINFEMPNINVGMTRNISKVNRITRIVDGKKYVTRTLAKLSDVSVKIEKDGQIKDEYFFTDEDNSYYYIYTGYDDDFKHGVYTYTINYTYNLGHDFINKFDDFSFDLLDYGGQSPIPHFTSSITLPKEFLSDKAIEDVLSFRTNEMIAVDVMASEKNFTYRVQDNTIFCEIFDMEKNQGLTVQLLLPNKYFNTRYTPSAMYIIAFILCFVSILATIGIVLYSRYGKKVVKTIEFYPPDNYSPIGVARAYRGIVKPKDFASLTLDWAAKGYVEIEFKNKKHIILKKLKDIDVPTDEKGDFKTAKKEVEYFNSLFKEGDVYDPEDLKTSYTLKRAVQSKSQKILKVDKKVQKKINTLRTIIYVLSILPMLLYAIWTTLSGFGQSFSYITIVFLFIAAMIIVYAQMPLSLVWFKVVWAGLFGGMPLAMMLMQNNFSIDVFKLGILSAITLVICVVISYFVVAYSQKDMEYRGKILGFRDFLLKAELDKLKRLLDEDPQYYYNILPYCYSLGITNKMQKRFKELKAPEPEYLGGYSISTFYSYYYASIITSSVGKTYSGTRGGSFGGGGFGGSSGGGGGGGGFGGR